MLKNYRLIATVLVFAASSFGAFAQTNETDNYKDVLLNGKPAKLNLTTGEVTYTNGEIAKSRAAKKIKDSLLDTRTEIKTNLIKDMMASSEVSESQKVSDSVNVDSVTIEETEESIKVADTEIISSPENSSEDNSELIEDASAVANRTSDTSEDNEDANASDFHTVKEGENLYVISKRYKTTLNQLITANNLETTLIKPGQNLRVKNFDFSETEIIWVVSKGDTLYSIAKKNNTTIDDLKDINGITGNLIKIGQKLQVNQNSTLTKK